MLKSMDKSMVVKLQFVSVIDKRLRVTVARFAGGNDCFCMNLQQLQILWTRGKKQGKAKEKCCQCVNVYIDLDEMYVYVPMLRLVVFYPTEC